MRKLLIPLLFCALLLTACGGQEADGGPAAAAGPKRTSSAVQDEKKEAVRSAVKSALAGTFDGELTVRVRTDRVEVSVLLNDPAYSADAEPPADWAEMREETAATTLSLSEALKDLGEYRALIYLMDQQEAILLTAFNGRAAFDKFEKRSGQSGGTEGLTLAAFDSVFEGMGYEEVCGLLGGEGELLSSVEDGESLNEIYSWSGADGASVTVVFENGAMASKSQVGLEPVFDDFGGGSSSGGSFGGVAVLPGGSVSIGGGSIVGVEVEVVPR